MPEHSHLFIAGLHRSGTSLLTKALAEHPEASSFSATGYPEDEGQFLQRAYPVAKIYGGPGKFGFDPRAHMTETSPLASEETGARLRAEWGRHWDLSKRLLIEKSPPNLLKLRFLQRMFPDANFLVLTRHPIAVAMATQKWSRTSVHSLLRHWLVCHEIFRRDAASIRSLTVIRYEQLVADVSLVSRLQAKLGLEPAELTIKPRAGVNEKYFRDWSSGRSSPLRAALARGYERRANRFGYSLVEPERALEGELALPRRPVAASTPAWRLDAG